MIKIGDLVRVQHRYPSIPPEQSLEFKVEEFIPGYPEYARGHSLHSGAFIRWPTDQLEVIKESS